MKKKIAIFGAGMSGLAAAHTLTNDPAWSDAYDVTVYQLGWRVGGKTTTGRGKFGRIEEHGIHILQGWYENTFALIQDVYAERARRNLDPDSPFQAWRDGFVNDSATLLTEWIPGRGWVNWPMIFPTNDAVPGDGVPLSLMEIVKKGLAVFLETLLGSPYQTGQSELGEVDPRPLLPAGLHRSGAGDRDREARLVGRGARRGARDEPRIRACPTSCGSRTTRGPSWRSSTRRPPPRPLAASRTRATSSSASWATSSRGSRPC